MYNKVDEKFIADLQAIAGKEHVYVDPDTLDQYKTDEETDPAKFHTPEAVVAPGSTEEVAAIVKLANEANIPITVRSAGTSLSDGAIAVCGGIILLMGRMNRILEVNTEGLYMVAEAGALVKECQAAAKEHNLVYAGDPSSAETCQIGGNLATNAGGIKCRRNHECRGLPEKKDYGLCAGATDHGIGRNFGHYHSGYPETAAAGSVPFRCPGYVRQCGKSCPAGACGH